VVSAAPVSQQNGNNLHRLVSIMRTLRAPDGCPWDRAQTLETLRPFVVEEAHEVVDAIDQGSPSALREELGDLLLQIVFQSEIANDESWFGIDDVIDTISEKMTRRHPWVFGDEKVGSEGAGIARWEELKAEERREKGDKKGTLDGVPLALPALLRAVRVGEKAASVGYDWPDASGAWDKVHEELTEVGEAAQSGDDARVQEELGDLLFAIASFARKRDLDPEAALRGSLSRFSDRFSHAERAAEDEGRPLRERTPEELDQLWQAAKAST